MVLLRFRQLPPLRLARAPRARGLQPGAAAGRGQLDDLSSDVLSSLPVLYFAKGSAHALQDRHGVVKGTSDSAFVVIYKGSIGYALMVF